MSTIKDDNKVTCVSCGHINYIRTDQVSVRVLDLQKTDIGLVVSTHNNSGILLNYNFTYSPDKGFEGFVDIEESLMYEAESVREFITTPEAMIRVYRPSR